MVLSDIYNSISVSFYEPMRFIWVHAIVHILSLVDGSSDGLHIFLALVRTTFIRVGWQGGFSSNIFTPALLSGWNLTIGFVLFCMDYFRHHGVSEENVIPLFVLEGTYFDF